MVFPTRLVWPTQLIAPQQRSWVRQKIGYQCRSYSCEGDRSSNTGVPMRIDLAEIVRYWCSHEKISIEPTMSASLYGYPSPPSKQDNKQIRWQRVSSGGELLELWHQTCLKTSRNPYLHHQIRPSSRINNRQERAWVYIRNFGMWTSRHQILPAWCSAPRSAADYRCSTLTRAWAYTGMRIWDPHKLSPNSAGAMFTSPLQTTNAAQHWQGATMPYLV